MLVANGRVQVFGADFGEIFRPQDEENRGENPPTGNHCPRPEICTLLTAGFSLLVKLLKT
jgi:hypothetical protein